MKAFVDICLNQVLHLNKKNTKTKFQLKFKIMSTHLPQELVEQILPKLPMKSLVRFSTVSKEWYKLITKPKPLENSGQFLLCCHNGENEYIFYSDQNGTLKEYARHKAPQEEGSTKAICCSNGIICFSDYEQCVILWNPSIRKYLRLPKSNVESDDRHRFTFGVVVDHINNDYKVLRTDNYGDMVEIFRVSNGSWELITCQGSKAPFLQIYGYQVDLKGVSYWVGINFDGKLTIVSFDVHEESWGSVKLPMPVENDDETHWYDMEAYLFLLVDSLVLIHSVHSGEDSDEDPDVDNTQTVITYVIWKMEDGEGTSWKLWGKISFYERVWPLGFRENGEFLWAGQKSKELISMNPEKGSHTSLGRFSAAKNIHSCPNYVESFALFDAARKKSPPPSL